MTQATATRNKLGFSVLAPDLHAQVFPNKPRPVLTEESEVRVREHYKQFDAKLPPAMPDTVQHDWKLPKLLGPDLRSHFEAMAAQFAEPYDARARKLTSGIPDMPQADEVLVKPGWHRYVDGQEPVQVPYPTEDAFVLDCETYVIKGAFPIIAVAVSTEAWYIWLDPALCDLSLDYTPRLYPIGGDKLVAGHNVTYDWTRCIESHWLDVPDGEKRSYFLDTMSMHIVCNGYSGPQRWAANAAEVPSYATAWASVGSANSLLACYNFHTWPEVPLTGQDKELRDVFVTQDLPTIRKHFLDLIQYAMLDVQYTWELFSVLYNKFRRKRPSWVALAGVLQQSAHNLPVVDNWLQWLGQCEAKLDEYEKAIDTVGQDIAKGLVARFNAWLASTGLPEKEAWQLHNSWLAALKQGEPVSEASAEWLGLMQHEQLGYTELDWSISIRAKSNRGVPEWFRGATEFGRSSRLLHQLMCFSFNGKPVFWRNKQKWCWQDDAGKWHTICKPGTESPASVLLTKDFKDTFDSKTLQVTGEQSQGVLKLAMAITYWVSCRGRAKDQIVQRVAYKHGEANVIVPDLVPTGTVSGRGVSPLWLTVTDCKPYNSYKIGVELKSRVQAPPGKVLLQADFSAQELRIGATYADSIAARESYDDKSQLGYIGSCLMSHGVYAGNKELGTDPHTMLAKSVGMSRDGAKTAGYAILYGGGKNTVAEAIMWDYASLPEPKEVLQKRARAKAEEFLKYKKGKVSYGTGVYVGGTDSAAFTVLAQLASQPYPKTPLLGNELTAPLCPAHCGDDYATGRTNWGIQATARDQGDCVSVAFHWLCEQHDIDARIIFLMHDEFVVLADETDAKAAAWLLNVAHLWTWAFTAEAMEIYDLCDVGKFFDDVIIQKAFRKAANLKSNTPSNPDEDLPDGEVLLEWDMPRLNDLVVAKVPDSKLYKHLQQTQASKV